LGSGKYLSKLPRELTAVLERRVTFMLSPSYKLKDERRRDQSDLMYVEYPLDSRTMEPVVKHIVDRDVFGYYTSTELRNKTTKLLTTLLNYLYFGGFLSFPSFFVSLAFFFNS